MCVFVCVELGHVWKTEAASEGTNVQKHTLKAHVNIKNLSYGDPGSGEQRHANTRAFGTQRGNGNDAGTGLSVGLF